MRSDKDYFDNSTHHLSGNMYHWVQSPEGYWQRIIAGRVAWEVVPAVDQYGNPCAAYRKVGPEGEDVDRGNVVVERDSKNRVDDTIDRTEGQWSEWNDDVESQNRLGQIAHDEKMERKRSNRSRTVKSKKKKIKANWIWCRTLNSGRKIIEKKTRNRKKFKRSEIDKQRKSETYWRNQEIKKQKEREGQR